MNTSISLSRRTLRAHRSPPGYADHLKLMTLGYDQPRKTCTDLLRSIDELNALRARLERKAP